MKLIYISLLVIAQIALSKSGDLDPTFGENGTAILDSQSRIPWLQNAESYEGFTFSAIHCINDTDCSLSTYRLDPDGKPSKVFGEKGKVTVALKDTKWPIGSKGTPELLKIIPENWYDVRFVLSDWKDNRSFSVKLSGTFPAPGATNIGYNVADSLFFEDGTFFTASHRNHPVVNAYQSNGAQLNSFGDNGSISIPGSPYDTANFTRVGDSKIRLTTLTDKGKNRGIQMVQFDKNGNPDLKFGEWGSIEYTFDMLEWILDTSVDTLGNTSVLTGPASCRAEKTKCRADRAYRVWKFDRSGQLDYDFGQSGFKWLSGFVSEKEDYRAAILDQKGRMVFVIENLDQHYLVRLTETGKLDLEFGRDGVLPISGYSGRILVDKDGKYVITGKTGTALWVKRYLP